VLAIEDDDANQAVCALLVDEECGQIFDISRLQLEEEDRSGRHEPCDALHYQYGESWPGSSR
jgi:hypothetical protein